MKRLFVCYVTGVVACFQHAPSADAKTLNEALAYSYHNNPSILSARQQLKATDETANLALSGALPNISLSYQRGRENQTIGTTDSDVITDSKSGQITQPIFRGGETYHSLKEAKANILGQREELNQVVQDIFVQVVSTYVNTITNFKVWQLNQANVTIFEEHLAVSKERFRLGEITKTDVAQSDASLADAKLSLIRAESNYITSLANYKRIIGIEANELTFPNDPISLNVNLQELTELAFAKNPNILAAQFRSQSAQNNIRVEKSALLPDVDLVALRQEQKGSVFSNGQDIDTDSLTLQVSVPLYQGGSSYASIRQAKHNYAASKFDLEAQRRQTKEDTISAYQNYRVAKASIKSTLTALDAFKRVLDGTERESKIGARTTLDVLEAQQDVFEAEVDALNAKRDLIVSAYNILSQIGRLNINDLKIDTHEYDSEAHYKKTKFQIIGF